MTKPIIDIVGRKYEMWTVISLAPRDGKVIRWLCQCDCGKRKTVSAGNLKNGSSSNCGCLNIERVSKLTLTHGLSHTKEFHAWRNMIRRCTDPQCEAYKHYGGRGIKICERWMESFENFLEDMGYKPHPKMSIERIDNNKDYEPNNCTWATGPEQGRNKRGVKLTINNAIDILKLRQKGQTYKEIGAKFGVSESTVYVIVSGKQWKIAKGLFETSK